MSQIQDDTLTGGSRVLVFAYGVLAISASVRALYQVATKWQQAPLAYVLTTIAALIYWVACIGFTRRSPRAWRLTLFVCSFELIGVIAVGCLTLFQAKLFPAATVWSDFGIGYGFAPLLLPAIGIWWLNRSVTRAAYQIAL